jgi:hypothetical protein
MANKLELLNSLITGEMRQRAAVCIAIFIENERPYQSASTADDFC